MKINIPAYVKAIIDVLGRVGFEAYVVGGAVRDALLGESPEDWDVTTSAPVEDVQSLFKKHFDTGIKHGTVTVLSGEKTVEVTTYRIDGEYSDNRHPENVKFTKSLAEDLKRRDFTVNALAYNDETGVVDLFGGISDMKNKIIRCVGDPDRRFSEDALRILRAVRFSLRLGFEIEEKTFDSVKRNAHLLKNISAERIYSELKKILACEGNTEILYSSKIIKTIFDNAQNNSKILENVPCVFETRLAALLLGMNDEERRKNLSSLKPDNKTKSTVLKILKLYDEGVTFDKAAVREKLGAYGPDVFRKYLDLLSASGGNTDELCEILTQVKDDPVLISDLAVNGRDLGEMGISGKNVGRMLEFLLSEVIKTPEINNREILLETAKTKKSCNIY